MDYDFRFKYETLRSLLNKNGQALQIMSDLEADLNHMRYYDKRIKGPIQRLITRALLMAQELNLLTGNSHTDLYQVLFRIGERTDNIFSSPRADSSIPGPSDKASSSTRCPFVLPLTPQTELTSDLVGGKAMGIWQLSRKFEELAPPGFIVTTAAYNKILEDNNLQDRIRLLLDDMDVIEDQALFQSRTETIRRLIRSATVDSEIVSALSRQVDSFEKNFNTRSWAVRSSAVCEDGLHSFAGQFDSELQIQRENLVTAYLNVLASRFTDRAVGYRAFHHFSEVDTPMAVLFMPMVDAAAAGVLHTRDTKSPQADTMVISSVPGLADRMVKGEEQADTWTVVKRENPKIIEAAVRTKTSGVYITPLQILDIARIAQKATVEFGHELDIEWAMDKDGKIRFLQARPLNLTLGQDSSSVRPPITQDSPPVLEAGITISPGRAEGPLVFLTSGDNWGEIPEGAIVLVEHSLLELGTILPKIAALLVMEGSPVDHLSTLVREFSVPCIFGIGASAHLLLNKEIVSVNATRRRVYNGVRWPGIRERVMARISAGNRHQKKSGPLYDLVLALNLLDPDASSFKASSCRSIHDTLRFMHEMSVRSLFGFGDSETRGWHTKSSSLLTDLPLKFRIIDLDNSTPEGVKKIPPMEVQSIPFQALWQGISDERLFWPDRWEQQMRGMPSDFKETVLGGNRGPRRNWSKNYAMVAGDYLNLNARFDYHYAMVDAMVGPGAENNHVHFRFRGGGGGDENRIRRARFLERVLRQLGFGVDRSGDLVTAWLRRYSRIDSEEALKSLGRLMVCARQLDAVFNSDRAIEIYADAFMNKEYTRFV